MVQRNRPNSTTDNNSMLLTVEERYNGEPVQEYTFQQNMTVKRSTVRKKLSSVKAMFSEVFLPQGYPNTVSRDYLAYQFWDTVQAFASSLNGALATLAVLKGAGVGNEQATVLAAALTWLLKDGVGMVARIVFAWAKGTRLDSDCKRWRLFADVLNDCSFLLDLLAPHFPPIFFAPFACFASFLRSIVGVAGYTTRMTLIRHQARRDNLADVAAKDGSQETLVNIFSLLVSLGLLPLVDGRPLLIWTLFTLFTGLHLFANYRAIKTLQMDTLNQARFAIAVRHFIQHGYAPSIHSCNKEEPILTLQQDEGPLHLGCALADLPKPLPLHKMLMAREESDGTADEGLVWKTIVKKTTIIICAVHEKSNEAWMAISAEGAVEADLFDALFAIQYFVEQKSWPSPSTTSAFRHAMAAQAWDMQTNQLNIEEWRFGKGKKSQ